MNRYFAFGLHVASELPLPELLAESDPLASIDVEIRESAEPIPDGRGMPEAGGPSFRLSIPGIADFLIRDGASILFFRAPGAADMGVRLYLLGSCFGSLLQQRGRVVLHGNAVTLDGKTCRIVVGHSGAGKSTSAALAYQQGARILADDVCAITFDEGGTAWVHPSYPQLKLWKSSADLLGIPVDGLRQVHPGEEKYALPIRDRFWPTPLPLSEVIELNAGHTDESPLRGFDKVRCLTEHSYRQEYLQEMGLQADYLKLLMRLANRVDVRRGVRAVIGATTNAEPEAPVS